MSLEQDTRAEVAQGEDLAGAPAGEELEVRSSHQRGTHCASKAPQGLGGFWRGQERPLVRSWRCVAVTGGGYSARESSSAAPGNSGGTAEALATPCGEQLLLLGRCPSCVQTGSYGSVCSLGSMWKEVASPLFDREGDLVAVLSGCGAVESQTVAWCGQRAATTNVCTGTAQERRRTMPRLL